MNYDEMEYTDTELIRARMMASELPSKMCMEYLHLLASMNAIQLLLSPSNDAQPDDLETERLEQFYLEHHQRRLAFEAEYPELVVLSRPRNWRGH